MKDAGGHDDGEQDQQPANLTASKPIDGRCSLRIPVGPPHS